MAFAAATSLVVGDQIHPCGSGGEECDVAILWLAYLYFFPVTTVLIAAGVAARRGAERVISSRDS